MTTPFDDLRPNRQKTTAAATDGCWEGTPDLVAAVVGESMGFQAWKPARASVLHTITKQDVHMTVSEFALWRKLAKGTARILKLPDHPRVALGFSESRYNYLGNAKRSAEKNAVIKKIEAMACAHYLIGEELPFTTETLAAWYWPRFGQLASVADALEITPSWLAENVNGYAIENGERITVTPDPVLMRALAWTWRNGSASPYGERKIIYYPEQKEV